MEDLECFVHYNSKHLSIISETHNLNVFQASIHKDLRRKYFLSQEKGWNFCPKSSFSQMSSNRKCLSFCHLWWLCGYCLSLLSTALGVKRRVNVQSDRFSISGKKINIGDFVNQPLSCMEKIVCI